ncbi:hypothetical protein J2S43_003725 [Catenuloplanes nepalensis]|uniref:Uncharacterized protein n=1 Tax=Catenuloplanes nepalensis TaxID=587533 RepID=A0ABT9MVF5_9ACTN|nr:hypothetical protein [Catenuloplanes nepalensis]MDP9795213.1 hypothetical protein [Catenuloplanes nepalensis]
MADDDQKPNTKIEFIRNAPALLSGLATLLVALTGLLALLLK